VIVFTRLKSLLPVPSFEFASILVSLAGGISGYINTNVMVTNAGEAIELNGDGSTDPDENLITYQWDFGEGTAGTGEG
jgi:hypothetical protein